MRTLNDIVPPSRRKDSDSFPPKSDPSPSRQRSSGFPVGTFIVILFVIFASIGALFYFSNAKIEVTPNTVSAAVQNSFTAAKSTGDLPYEVITAQKIASQNVASTGSKAVNSSASGTITIYNTQSKSQRLIANTRFATTAGLIFRIREAVTVPAGTSSKPGTISAKVYADQPGASYNVGPTSFTLPGLAGSPQASQVYARSTSAMTGGASGSMPIVDATLEEKTRAALRNALTPDLLASIQAQIPAGYVLLPTGATTSFEALQIAPSSTTGEAEVREQGTITAIVFPNAALAKAVAESVSGLGYQGEPVALASVTDLMLSSARPVNADDESFSFTLSGTAPLVYTVDPSRIAAAISGKSRSEAEIALTSYPEVKRAIITLRPFWRKSFPEDPSSISVVITKGSY